MLPGDVDLSLTWKRSRADEHWSGTSHDLDRERKGNNVENFQDVLDLRATLSLTPRWSATASVPWVLGSWSLPLPVDPPGPRYEQDASGFGDLVLSQRTWILDPGCSPDGNLQFGIGVKLPTGDHDARDPFPDLTGGNVARKAVDVSLQPGDGGWGFLAELSGFRDAGPVRFFGLGTYLINPRDSNGTLSTPSVLAGPANVPPEIRFNSVPDYYFAQAGAALSLGKGWTASASLRWEGVPVRDLVGGEDGFRRPGYALSAAPGLAWSFDRYSLSASVPITLLRNAQEDAHGYPGDASFADWSLLVSFAVRF